MWQEILKVIEAEWNKSCAAYAEHSVQELNQ